MNLSIHTKYSKHSKIKVTFLFFGLSLLLALPQGLAAKGKPGGGTDTGHVSMTATGYSVQDFVVDAFQKCEERLAANDTSYLCNNAGTGHDIMLGDFLMNHNYPNGSTAANCFGAGYFPVTFGVDLLKKGSAETVLRFGAFKNDRVTEVLYVLIVNDPRGWSGGAFPPVVGSTTTMGQLDGSTEISWVLRTSNKNQARDACVDSGIFDPNGSDFIRVDFHRID